MINKVIAIYTGRFQPFHAAHNYSYNELVKKFGKDNVYIGTSNKVDLPTSPLTFHEKKAIMIKMFGIPKDKIVQVKNPYKAEEITSQFPGDTTAAVFGLGEKDSVRLGGKYFTKYSDSIELLPYPEKGYIFPLSHESQPTYKGQVLSGTLIRMLLGDPRISIGNKKKYFGALYPKFDQKVFDLLVKKFMTAETDPQKESLQEGGAYGHMNHPFEDRDLTFADMKAMIDMALSGKLQFAREKTDGQNLMFSWINGQLRAARNKSHLKNSGANSMTKEQVQQMFKGRGEIENAFVYAMNDLEKAISAISEEERLKLFQNGKKFMSMEVIYPQTTNVIPYGMPMLIFQDSIEYNEEGVPVKVYNGDGIILGNLVKKVNADVQGTFNIRPLEQAKFKKSIDLATHKKQLYGEIDNLRSAYHLKDTDTLESYIREALRRQLHLSMKGIDNDLESVILNRLMGNKSISSASIRKQIKNPAFLKRFDTMDKNIDVIIKEILRPFETIFLKLGVSVMRSLEGLLAVNPDEALDKIKSELDKSIKAIKSTGDKDKIKKLAAELKRLKSIGGVEAILPSEGISFLYNGQLYKLTGAFAPLNKILGTLRYAR